MERPDFNESDDFSVEEKQDSSLAEYELKPEQAKAVSLKLEGKTYREIADLLDKSPTTINNWFNHCDEVRFALDREMEEMYSETRERMTVLNKTAIDLIFDAVGYAKKEAEVEMDYRPVMDMAINILKASGTHGDNLKEILNDMRKEQKESNNIASRIARLLEGMDDTQQEVVLTELESYATNE